MSIYLGDQLVGVSIGASDTIEASTPHLKNFMSGNADTDWTRPAGWPDLDSLNLTASGDDYIYMTYDASKEASAVALYIDGSGITVSIGYISNGVYTVEETITGSSKKYELWLDNYTGYKVVKVVGTSIISCYTYTITNSTTSQKQLGLQQPILERIAYLPHYTGGRGSSQNWGTYLLQREKFMTGSSAALTSLSYQWYYCHNLRSLDVSDVNTTNVTNMTQTFYECYSLGKLDLSSWSVSKVTTFNKMFYHCETLKQLTLSNWTGNTNSNCVCDYMFSQCKALEEINGISNLVTAKTTSIAYMFEYCKSLKDVSFIKNWNTSNVTSMSYLFNNCTSLTKIDLSSFNTSKVTNISNMFGYCYNLREIVFSSGWDVSKVTNFDGAFGSCSSLKEIPGINNWNTSSATNLNSVFSGCQSLESINLNTWTTTNVTTLSNMFNNCGNLKSVGTLSNWNTSNVTSLSSMFNNCYSLTIIPSITSWDLKKVTNTSSMFYSCYSLVEVLLPNLNMPLNTNMASMFRSCYNLKTINLGGWTLTAMTSTAPNYFLNQCYSLTNILGITIPPLAISLSDCRSLTHEAVMTVINALPQLPSGTTKTLNIVTDNINRLTTDEKAIATGKGWTLAN